MIICYNYQAFGGIAQLARVLGSYPIGRWFEPNCRYQQKAPPSFGSAAIQGPMVKRSRHRPFTAVTRVRFPIGSPDEGYKNTPKKKPNFRFLLLLRSVRPHSRFRCFRRGNRGKSNSITAPLSARLSSGIILSFYRHTAQRDK